MWPKKCYFKLKVYGDTMDIQSHLMVTKWSFKNANCLGVNNEIY